MYRSLKLGKAIQISTRAGSCPNKFSSNMMAVISVNKIELLAWPSGLGTPLIHLHPLLQWSIYAS